MAFNPKKSFNDLPLLPPPTDLETKPIMRKVASCARAVAELKGLGLTIPNQALLVDSLILQEAKDSSAIENIITTNDALFQAFTAKTGQFDSETKEVLRYREAVWAGYNALNERSVLSTNLFVKLVQIIKGHQAGVRNTPGTAIANATTGEIIYTPPEGESVIRDKLKNLEDFIHAEDSLDPLIKLAVAHYQFEAIHPFSDGNGRTGRIINVLFLVQSGLLELPVLYLSKAIIEHKSEYYRLLRAVTEKSQWEPWILFMLSAIEETAIFTRDRIVAIRDLMFETMEKAKKNLSSRVYSKELIEIIFRQPYTKAQFLVDAGLVKRQAAAENLKALVHIGIMEQSRVGKETIYLNTGLYDLLSK